MSGWRRGPKYGRKGDGPPHFHVKFIAAQALASARQQGCICSPKIDIKEPHRGVYSASIYHDNSCPCFLKTKAGTN